jgi:leucyl-tRNA synthetase
MTWFHNGLDSFIYAHLHRFLGYLLHDMALTDEPEPIANYHGHALVQLAGRKMSKSEGNTVDALTLLDEVGADVLRVEMLWAGNPMQTIEWKDEPPKRVRSFLSSVQRLVLDNLGDVKAHAGEEPVGESQAAVRRSSEKVSLFIDQYRPGAALDELHRLLKHLTAVRKAPEDAAVFANGVVALVQLLGPFAPHLAEELWEALGLGSEPLAVGGWPV